MVCCSLNPGAEGAWGVRQMNAFETIGHGRTDSCCMYRTSGVRERVGFKEPKRSRSH